MAKAHKIKLLATISWDEVRDVRTVKCSTGWKRVHFSISSLSSLSSPEQPRKNKSSDKKWILSIFLIHLFKQEDYASTNARENLAWQKIRLIHSQHVPLLSAAASPDPFFPGRKISASEIRGFRFWNEN
jgi:hypothetical protein